MRFAILIALGLVVAAGLRIGAQLIARDSPAPARTHVPDAAKPEKPKHRRPVNDAATTEAKRPRIQVTAPVDHPGREGIEEAEVDSHQNASGADG